MDGAALAGIVIGVLATVIFAALPLAYPDISKMLYRSLLWISIGGTLIFVAYFAATKYSPQRVAPVVVMSIGLVMLVGGMLWFRSTPADTPTPATPATAQTVTDQSQPAPDSPAPAAQPPPAKAKPPQSSGPSFQQDNRGSTGTNLQGQFNAPITVNPPYDPAVPVTIYEFNGAKRKLSPGRNELEIGEAVTSFQAMAKMADAGEWQALLTESGKWVSKTDGKWDGARAFNGIALVRLGRKDEGYAALSQVESRLETIQDSSIGYFNSLVSKYIRQQ